MALSAALLASLVATVAAPAVFAAPVTVTAATGGTVSADTAVSGSTALTGPVIAESAAGDIPTGLLAFSAPAGYAFDTTGGAPSFTGGGTGFAMIFVSRTATTMTYQVTAPSTAAGTVTFTGWTVKATAGTPLAAAGNITLNAGGSVPAGVTTGSAGTNFGTLTEVHGTTVEGPGDLVVTASTLTPAANATVSLTVQYVDQFGNPTPDPHGTFLTVAWSQTSSGATGTFSAVTPFNAGTGTATASFTVGATAGQTYTLTATDAWTSNGTVGPIVVAAVPPPPPSSATDYTFTATGAGSVPTTGTSGVVSIAVGEHIVNGWDAAGNTLTFTLQNTGATWSGTPAISGAPSSLGTFTVSGSGTAVLTVHFTASNIGQIENFTLGGMTIDTDSTPTGPLRVLVAKTAGGGAGTIPFGTGTASATINGDLVAGSTSVPYTLDDGSFPFAATDANNGNLLIAAPDAESRGIASGGNPLTLAVATGAFHADGTAITQSVAIQGLLIVGTVVPTLTETAVVSSVFPQPGEFNNVLTGASVTVTESGAATLATSSVVTFTLDTAGVVFSTAPTATPGANGLRLNGAAVLTAVPCALSFDRTSCSVTVTTKSTAASTVSISAISVDIAASVVQGTKIGVDVTTSPAVPVSVTSKTIATVARIAVGVAAQPTIFINENDQSTGVITLTESRAGILTAAAGNNYFGICLATPGETFTRAPWAIVTTGDLKLRSGVVGATTVQGNLVSSTCVSWIIYTNSTVASTIEIRGADASNVILPAGANNGPRVSVAAGSAPGANAVRVLNGSQTNVEGNLAAALVTTVSNAIQAFRNQPVVAAVTQPVVPKGSLNSLAGCLTITETQAGQFKAGETITATILPRTSTTIIQARQDIFLKTGTTADLPLVTTNTPSGLLTGAVSVTNTTLSFGITQQATGTLGVITICNIHLVTLADAADGAVLVRVQGSGGSSVVIDQVVSIGKIGVAVAGTASTRLGVTQTGAFTTGTKVQKVGKYVTYRFDFGVAAAGQHIDIWGATKTGNDWSAFSKVTSRVANASGVVYYYIRQSSATWKSYRAMWAGGGVFTPARQARWIP